jgi:hypothetical protein
LCDFAPPIGEASTFKTVRVPPGILGPRWRSHVNHGLYTDEEKQRMWTVKAGLIGLVALSLGCGTGRSSPSPAPQPDTTPTEASKAGPNKTPVEIDNQNFSDMNIYLMDGGARVFLGSAAGLSKTTLLIPAGATGGRWQVRLLADPIGGSSSIGTPSLLVAPGQSVYWTIGADPSSSFASAG